MKNSSPVKARALPIAFLMQESNMGGIEYNSLHLAGRLDTARFQVDFLCPSDGKLPGLLRQEGRPCRFYRRGRFFSTSTPFFGRHVLNPFALLYDLLLFPRIVWGLAKALKAGGYRLVVTKGLLANFYGSLAARLAGVTCLWDMQEIVSNRKACGLLSRVLSAWANAFVDGIAASSEAIREQFSASARAKVHLLPNGIDTDAYNPDVPPSLVRTEWAVAPDEPLVGHVARLTRWKGQLDFVAAAARVAQAAPRTRFAVVGAPVFEDAAYEREVRAAASGLGARIVFPGFRDDLAQVLAALDVFVHCPIEPEGCPLTLITAMAMAKPIVATRVTGIVELVGPDQALLVEPGRPEALARAVLDLLGDCRRAKRLGRSARDRAVELYSLSAYARKSSEIFELLVRGAEK